jgi:transcriptional regulator with XRE-family HTH domain
MVYTREERLLLRRLGARIRQCRTAVGWSQEELAFQTDLHRNYIGGVERGERNVAALNLIRLAKVLKVPVGHFFN